ncbi:NAD(P)/FAD-dependent oxidoreductase [Streptomyces mirabilis]
MTESKIAMRDCIVIGAGAAGLSASLALARTRRSILVIDAGGQSNLAASSIGSGSDRRRPSQFYAAGSAALTVYRSVELYRGEVPHGVREDDGSFTVTFSDGRREQAQSMVLATGMDYRHPRLPGMDDRWGSSVFHSPFCHGWDNANRTLGVLGSGAGAVHGALSLRAWSDRITLLTNGSKLTDEQCEQLEVGEVTWDERPITGLDGPGTELRTAVFDDGDELSINSLLVRTSLHQRSSLARDLGASLTEPDEILDVEAIRVDALSRTGVPGLYAAGDAATSVVPSMAAAAASGHLAGTSAAVRLGAGC